MDEFFHLNDRRMNDQLNAKENELLRAYCEQNQGQVAPEWAYQFAPSIPFVGDDYGRNGRPKVLIYASAENLTYTRNQKVEIWLQPKNQMIRSRVFHSVKHGTNIHIQPIDNGSLLKAARHSLEQVVPKGKFSTESPEIFLDQVAVANPDKFSVDSMNNKNYAGQKTPWLASKPFIEIDLEILDPDIIIIPKTILATLGKRPMNLNFTRPERTIIPNYQITAGTINRTIKPQLERSSVPKKRSLVEDWPLTKMRSPYAACRLG